MQRLIEHGEKNPEDKLTDKELTTEIMEIMYEYSLTRDDLVTNTGP